MSEPNPIDRIVRPQPVAVRTVWPGEASHFTPWLSENLDWLDVLELGPLEHVGTEVPIPNVGRNLDILAKTPGGAHVAIENQYLKTDHDHLTRGLAYALGVRPNAKALVVVSEAHRPEFVAIADYLNTAYERLGADDGIAIFLITLARRTCRRQLRPPVRRRLATEHLARRGAERCARGNGEHRGVPGIRVRTPSEAGHNASWPSGRRVREPQFGSIRRPGR